MSEIIASHSLLIAPTVLGEALWIYRDDERSEKVLINEGLIRELHPALQIATISDAERALAIALTKEMDDGEAETLAIASLRTVRMCSDDHAALRVAPRVSVVTVTTLELLDAWASAQSQARVRQALRSLRKRANYTAPRSHPLRDWFIRESSE
ncbi:MAG TPA: hypothetical protein VKT72_18200 [Candidatus Baltobacteraceae bacterium]|nr:hypothetical protein [Candidatus Baltobacteraceae bacterium]